MKELGGTMSADDPDSGDRLYAVKQAFTARLSQIQSEGLIPRFGDVSVEQTADGFAVSYTTLWPLPPVWVVRFRVRRRMRRRRGGRGGGPSWRVRDVQARGRRRSETGGWE